MVTLKDAKTAAARKKILIGVCDEFKEKFGEELDPAIVTKGKNEKELIGILKEIGADALEKEDNISEESEAIMLELELLSKSYLKAMKKAGGSKKEEAAAPEPKKGKKDKKGKKAKEEPAPEPEKKMTKAEKKAAKKAAKKGKRMRQYRKRNPKRRRKNHQLKPEWW